MRKGNGVNCDTLFEIMRRGIDVSTGMSAQVQVTDQVLTAVLLAECGMNISRDIRACPEKVDGRCQKFSRFSAAFPPMFSDQGYEPDPPVEFLGDITLMTGENNQFLNLPSPYRGHQSSVIRQLSKKRFGN